MIEAIIGLVTITVVIYTFVSIRKPAVDIVYDAGTAVSIGVIKLQTESGVTDEQLDAHIARREKLQK